jgi:hypothetical protein
MREDAWLAIDLSRRAIEKLLEDDPLRCGIALDLLPRRTGARGEGNRVPSRPEVHGGAYFQTEQLQDLERHRPWR